MVRWKKMGRSGNVQDRRGMRPKLAVGGIGGVILVIAALVLGVDPSLLLSGGDGAGPPAAEVGGAPPADDEDAQFVSAILASTEDVWGQVFRESGATYREPQLVLFEEAVQSRCGMAGAAVGPFYCPVDETVYLDLSFFRELARRFGAPGDFARAYVIGHEVGHHVQTLTGRSQQVRDAQRGLDQSQANALSVQLELQADCYAGVWAARADAQRDILEPGDVEEGLGAAAAIGDDAIQRQTQGTVRPESFTHGSSEQRVRWFRMGIESGDPAACEV